MHRLQYTWQYGWLGREGWHTGMQEIWVCSARCKEYVCHRLKKTFYLSAKTKNHSAYKEQNIL